MDRTFAYLFAMLWGAAPALAAFMCLGPWRRRRLAAAGLISPRLREGGLAFFWTFCGGMAMVTLTPRWLVWSLMDVLHGYVFNAGGESFFSKGTVHLTPFQTFGLDAHSLYILIGNLVMFLPFGIFIALLWRGCTSRRALAAGFGIAGFIECCQLAVGRACDIDDLLLNSFGVVCGYWLWLWLRRYDFFRRFHCRPS